MIGDQINDRQWTTSLCCIYFCRAQLVRWVVVWRAIVRVTVLVSFDHRVRWRTCRSQLEGDSSGPRQSRKGLREMLNPALTLGNLRLEIVLFRLKRHCIPNMFHNVATKAFSFHVNVSLDLRLRGERTVKLRILHDCCSDTVYCIH